MSRKEKINYATKYCVSVLVIITMYNLWTETFGEYLATEFEIISINLGLYNRWLFPVMFAGIILGAILEWTLRKNKGTLAGAGAVMMAVGFLGRKAIARGGAPLIMAVCRAINDYYDTNMGLGDYSEPKLWQVLFALACVIILFSALITRGIIAKPKKVSWISMAVIAIPVAMCLYAGVMPGILTSWAYIISVILYIAFNRTDETTDLINYTIPIGVIIVVITFSVGVNLKISKYQDDNFTKMEETKQLIARIEEDIRSKQYSDALDELKLDKLAGWVRKHIEKTELKLDIPGGIRASNYDGSLTNLSSRTASSHKRLEVVVDRKPKKNVYLKSFTAVTYNSSSWQAVSDNKFDDFLSPFDEKYWDVVRLVQHGKALEMAEEIDEVTYSEINHMVVKNIDEKKERVFEPYQHISKVGHPYRDAYYTSSDNSELSFEFVETCFETTNYMQAYERFVDSYDYIEYGSPYGNEDPVNILVGYALYAYERYTDGAGNGYAKLDEAIRRKLSSLLDEYSFYFQDDKVMRGAYPMFYTDMRDFMSRQFFEGYEYSLKPGETPTGQNQFVYFLEENKKGFCVHYATVATLAFQTTGIPARYVEGYMVPTEAFEEQSDGTYKAVVTDDMGHAWCETYSLENGWEVFEATPHYDNPYKEVDASIAEEEQRKANASKQEELEVTTQAEITTTPEATTTNSETTTNGETTTNANETTTQVETITQAGHSEQNKHLEVKKSSGVITKIIQSKAFRLAIGIAILVAFVPMQAMFRRSIKYKKYRNRTNKRTIVRMYNQIVYLCNVANTDNLRHKDDEEQIEQLKNNYNSIDKSEWDWMYQTANEVAFSNKNISKESYVRMERNLRKIRKLVMKDAGVIKKFIIKYIMAM